MTEPRTLYRKPAEGKIFGVAAGLADYFAIDVTLLRIILVVLVIAGAGFIIPAYILMAFLLPTPGNEPASGDAMATMKTNFDAMSREWREGGAGDRARNYFGVGLIVIGGWLLLVRLFPDVVYLRWDLLWPLALVLIGVMVLTKLGGRK